MFDKQNCAVDELSLSEQWIRWTFILWDSSLAKTVMQYSMDSLTNRFTRLQANEFQKWIHFKLTQVRFIRGNERGWG